MRKSASVGKCRIPPRLGFGFRYLGYFGHEIPNIGMYAAWRTKDTPWSDSSQPLINAVRDVSKREMFYRRRLLLDSGFRPHVGNI